MNEHLLASLEEISDLHIGEAAHWRRRRKARIWVRSVAAALAALMLLLPLSPEGNTVSAQELVAPAVYVAEKRPNIKDYSDEDDFFDDLDAYRAQVQARADAADEAMAGMTGFWEASFRAFLDGGENGVWSPVNAYISLAMLAQTSSGDTRQEILDVLGAKSIEGLQKDVQAVWEQIWLNNGSSKRNLANSLWLDTQVEYQQEVLNVLGERYYASVYRTELKSADQDIQTWVSQNTNGFLEDLSPADSAVLDRRVLEMVSTLFVDENWVESFDPKDSLGGNFKAPDGDVPCMYMNAQMDTARYLQGEDYTAVALSTEGGCRFWVVLPDTDSDVSALLDSGDYLAGILGQEAQSRKVNLKMPRFDITDSVDLKDGLRELGIGKAFSAADADFSGTFAASGGVWVDGIRQDARISVNETGIRASSGTVVDMVALSADDPTTVVLDRPFLFVLTLGDIPLFAGVVAKP